MGTGPQRVNRQHYLDVLGSLRGTEQVKVLQASADVVSQPFSLPFETSSSQRRRPPKHLLSALRRV